MRDGQQPAGGKGEHLQYELLLHVLDLHEGDPSELELGTFNSWNPAHRGEANLAIGLVRMTAG